MRDWNTQHHAAVVESGGLSNVMQIFRLPSTRITKTVVLAPKRFLLIVNDC